jgi:hypothetical protein
MRSTASARSRRGGQSAVRQMIGAADFEQAGDRGGEGDAGGMIAIASG